VAFQNIAVRNVSDVEISSLAQDIEISDLLYMYFISPHLLVVSSSPYFAFILKNSISVCVCVCVCVCLTERHEHSYGVQYRRVGLYDITLKKGKAIPMQAWTGLEGSMRLRLPDFMTIGT